MSPMLAHRSSRACRRVSVRSLPPMRGRISLGLGSRRSTMIVPLPIVTIAVLPHRFANAFGEVPLPVSPSGKRQRFHTIRHVRRTRAASSPRFTYPIARTSRFPDSRLQSPPRHGGYRMNAAATPESTGMITPVVRENSSETIAATAAAMCSGSTSRLRMVRCA